MKENKIVGYVVLLGTEIFPVAVPARFDEKRLDDEKYVVIRTLEHSKLINTF